LHVLPIRNIRTHEPDTARGEAPVVEKDNGIDRAVMKAQRLLSRVCCERPANDRGIEAAGDRLAAVGRYGECPHRSAMDSCAWAVSRTKVKPKMR
jgi:hypothetical protein